MNYLRNIIISIFLLSLFQISSFGNDCAINLGRLLEETRNNQVIDRIVEIETATIAAHGKNQNIAVESTWRNIKHSVESGGARLSLLEVDVMMTKDGKFVMMHDPTFHNLVKDYHTSIEAQNKFRHEFPELAQMKEGQYDFNLFDGADIRTLDEIKSTLKNFDPNSGLEFEFISLDELAQAIKVDGELRIPKHDVIPRALPQNTKLVAKADEGKFEEVIKASETLSLYIDFKPINNYTRRLYGLSDWNWIRASWSDAKLREYTARALKNLSNNLKSNDIYDKSFIAARHFEIAKMIKEIDPRINMMASPDIISKNFTADQFIKAFEEFEQYNPKLIEVKYLNHILDPKIRQWAKDKGYKILYNQIEQTDITQFEGIYKNNLGKLLDDITLSGDDIIFQTNTVGRLKAYFDSMYHVSIGD